jgi:hypothetical protein
MGVASTASLLSRDDYACPIFAGCVFGIGGSGRPSAGQPDDGVQELANELDGAGEEAVSPTRVASFFPDVRTAARRPIVQCLTRADTFGALSG